MHKIVPSGDEFVRCQYALSVELSILERWGDCLYTSFEQTVDGMSHFFSVCSQRVWHRRMCEYRMFKTEDVLTF